MSANFNHNFLHNGTPPLTALLSDIQCTWVHVTTSIST